jgi:homoserine kinase
LKRSRKINNTKENQMKHVKNPVAKALRTARFRPKVIKIKTKYDRKVLKKGSSDAPLSDSVYIVHRLVGMV